ncbi:GNAT family N-acetyltransferase [Enterobacillus tribolii]|uniref:Acetyltransferase (GNAT) family protein n=1 Tax=Enterobacillus tribolii TaxID=1487935 RepID=A0A370QS06_9GAMM|nr:GNAT family N-acetyltransferase [Enterobacillus tribolii]MBW7983467.1 GNAT family N-acetyltransferase [Enterobacillus tribolii]RDK92038.1 acetyltransferase (GNAT) family protein [Enterobacillus tribolii]
MLIRVAAGADTADMFRVRLSVNENKATMAELARYGVTPESLPAMLSGTGRGWVAEIDGVIRAFAMADAENATIFALFVEPGAEKQGIGRRLMNEAERWLAEMGCAQIWLETDSNTQVRANGFYRYLGWQESNRQPDGQVKFIKTLSRHNV